MQAINTVSQEEVRLSEYHPIKVQLIPEINHTVVAHDHEFYEVVYVQSGQAVHETVSGKRLLDAGDFLVLAPGQIHAISAPKGLTVFNTYYLSEWLLQDLRMNDDGARYLGLMFLGQNLFPGRAPLQPVHVTLATETAQLVEHELSFLSSVTQKPAPNGVLLRASLIKMFALLSGDLIDQLRLDGGFLEHPFIHQAWSRMDQALANGEPCNIAAWADAMNYAPDSFSRKYRALTGENPSVFFLRRRLQRGAHLLIHQTASVSEIAHQLGFNDQAHFSRSFRQQYTMSPLAYRRRFRSQ